MWPCGSKRTSLASWRCCERTPGSPCRLFQPGSRDEQPSQRCCERISSYPAGNGACCLRVLMAVRLSDSTGERPERAPISSLASSSWMWWASRLPASLPSWSCPTSRLLPFRPPFPPHRFPPPEMPISAPHRHCHFSRGRSTNDAPTCRIHKSAGDGSCPIRGEKSSQSCCIGSGREALKERCLFKPGHNLRFRDPQRVYSPLNPLLDGSALHHGSGTNANHSDSSRTKILRKASQECFHGTKGRANGSDVCRAIPGEGCCDKQDDS